MTAPRSALALTFVLGAFCALATPSVAGAAIWQGPVPISDASVQAGDTPRMALGASGDAAVSWWDNGGGGRLMLARKRAGGAWSAPVMLAASPSPLTVITGVDGNGNVTAVWSTGSATTVGTWPADAAAPSLATLDTSTLDVPEAINVTGLAVNPSGVAVLAGDSGTTRIVLGYRATPTGSFTISQKLGPAVERDAHVAINDAGSAVAIFSMSNTIWSTRLSAASPVFGPTDAVTTGLGTNPANLAVAIDQGGNILAGFTLTENMGSDVAVGTAWRPLNGDWVTQWPLSPTGSLTTFTAGSVSVAVNRSGTSIVAWVQAGPTPLDSSADARLGSSLTGVWGPIERINDIGVYAPSVAIGDDGTVVAAWEQDTTGGARAGQARVRTPAGVWSDTRTLDPPHLADTEPLVAADGRGHFAVATAPDTGATKQVLVSYLDMVAPAVSPVALGGTGLAGDPMSLAVTASDEWSAIPTVTWSFGDGASGTGLSVSHSYPSAGTYSARVVVTDAAGNTTTSQAAITIAAKQSTLTTAKFAGVWKQSRIAGTLLVKGTAPRAGAYVIDILKGKARKIHASFNLAAGAFAKTLTLPARLLPGTYRVALIPSFPATQVLPADRDAKLAGPATGVVDVSVLSGARNGPAARTLRNVDTIWASFHFAAVPKGKLKLTWYLTTKGKKRQNLGSTTKSPSATVVSFIRLGGRRGTITAVLARRGVVIAQQSVTTK